MNFQRLDSEVDEAFFDRDVVTVARDLIGRCLRVGNGGNDTRAVIVETEAYGDSADPASHAAFRPGGRAAIMAESAGLVYVYLVYGMYPCFNIVTGRTGHASAVLIRGVWRIDDSKPVYGPGRTTKLLGITADDHRAFIPGSRFGISTHRADWQIESTPRIGINRAVDTKWRFIAALEK